MLSTLEEWLNQSNVTGLLHDADALGEVNLGDDQVQQVVQGHWLLFEVEDDGLVEKIMIGHLDDTLAEYVMSEGSWGVVHHNLDGLVVLLVGLVQLDGLWPHLVLLTSSDKLWNVQLIGVGPDEVHQSLWFVLGEDDTQLSVDSVMSSLKSLALLQ